MKSAVGLLIAFGLGFACRAFGIPSPAPPMIMGALLIMTMTAGYIAVDRHSVRPANGVRNSGERSGQTASPPRSKEN